jgi:hypothetical protein
MIEIQLSGEDEAKRWMHALGASELLSNAPSTRSFNVFGTSTLLTLSSVASFASSFTEKVGEILLLNSPNCVVVAVKQSNRATIPVPFYRFGRSSCSTML